jgi:hypothetical protein
VHQSSLGLAQNILIAWIGTPALWCFIGFWLGGVSHRIGKVVFMTLMVAHYGGLLFLLQGTGHFADWGQARKLIEFVVGCVVLYAAGQIALWVVFFLTLRMGRMQGEETTP